MSDPAEIVNSFIAAVEVKDVELAVSHLAEDVSYENMPISPIVGRDAVRHILGDFLAPAGRVEWRIERQVVSGSVVVNERVDRFEIGGGWLELPVAGVFEVDPDGKISLWRDYFDMQTYLSRLAELTA
jgi:limonene-1,2-epoxide hydrolase